MKKHSSQPILFAAVMGIAAGIAYWAIQNFHAAPAEAAVEAPAAKPDAADTVRFAPDAPQLSFVRVMPAEAYPEPLIDSLNARITYDDNHTARVFSPIAGRVTKIAAEAGQYVKAGTPLLWIDSPDYGSGASDLLKAEADLSHKKETYERSKQLYEARGLAQKDLEQAEADWRQAVAEAERARARMKNLGARAVENAAGQYVLRAPIDGIISERQVNAGSEVRPDATNSLFVITNLNRVWVAADLPEQQIGKIKVGQPVTVEVDAYPGETFPGKVSVISETLDPNLRRLQVRCDVDNSQHKLKPEMYARISPVASNNEKLPRVPNTAIFTEGLYSYIFVEQSPGVLQRRRVALGMQDADFSFIREGLKAGERIVTSGALLLNSELNGGNE